MTLRARASCVAFMASALLSTGVVRAQPADEPEVSQSAEHKLRERIEQETPELEARRERIESELKALDRKKLPKDDWARDWAGTYYTGDGLGMNVIISIAPKSGLTYTWYGCMGLYDANHGDIVEVFLDGLRVSLAIDPKLSTYKYMSERLYFVRWGKRRYLVPEAQMLNLVNNYNQGGFARNGMYDIPLWFKGQAARTPPGGSPRGRPELPEKWARLLLDKQLTLEITKVTPLPTRVVAQTVTMLTFDLEFKGGSDDGVYEGLEFHIQAGTESGSVAIDGVTESTCTGRVRFFTGGEDLPPPAVGDVVTVTEPVRD